MSLNKSYNDGKFVFRPYSNSNLKNLIPLCLRIHYFIKFLKYDSLKHSNHQSKMTFSSTNRLNSWTTNDIEIEMSELLKTSYEDALESQF